MTSPYRYRAVAAVRDDTLGTANEFAESYLGVTEPFSVECESSRDYNQGETWWVAAASLRQEHIAPISSLFSSSVSEPSPEIMLFIWANDRSDHDALMDALGGLDGVTVVMGEQREPECIKNMGLDVKEA